MSIIIIIIIAQNTTVTNRATFHAPNIKLRFINRRIVIYSLGPRVYLYTERIADIPRYKLLLIILTTWSRFYSQLAGTGLENFSEKMFDHAAFPRSSPISKVPVICDLQRPPPPTSFQAGTFHCRLLWECGLVSLYTFFNTRGFFPCLGCATVVFPCQSRRRRRANTLEHKNCFSIRAPVINLA